MSEKKKKIINCNKPNASPKSSYVNGDNENVAGGQFDPASSSPKYVTSFSRMLGLLNYKKCKNFNDSSNMFISYANDLLVNRFPLNVLFSFLKLWNFASFFVSSSSGSAFSGGK